MHYPSLAALIADRQSVFAKGPICLILIEDEIAVAATLRHHAAAGFGTLVAFCDPGLTWPDLDDIAAIRVDHPVTASDALPEIVNAVIAACPGQWVYYCYNAEFLFFPFSESRSIAELLTFMAEERRDHVMTHIIDLYARDLTAHPHAVDLEAPYLDRSGYFALPRQDATGQVLDRQIDIFGGLRWRYEEFIPPARRKLDRIALFRSAKGLQMLPDRSFTLPEYNTFTCPWHHSPTAAIFCSTAKR